jgi:poly(3-hydroxybutyrate) depolymerase
MASSSLRRSRATCTSTVRSSGYGGGHMWPGGTQYFPASLIGTVSQDFSANDAMWAFFARHPRP